VKPKLACYCAGSFFAYALEWELFFDSRYHVISTYLSPRYKGMLFKQGKKESYVKVAKEWTVEYGEGLVGEVGSRIKHCFVEMISEEFTKINDNVVIHALTEDQIQTVLYFSSHDGRKVIEVGGYNRYHLVEGVTLDRLKKILAGESRVKNLKRCLTKVPLSEITNNKPFIRKGT